MISDPLLRPDVRQLAYLRSAMEQAVVATWTLAIVGFVVGSLGHPWTGTIITLTGVPSLLNWLAMGRDFDRIIRRL